jgi:hypothetical protein
MALTNFGEVGKIALAEWSRRIMDDILTKTLTGILSQQEPDLPNITGTEFERMMRKCVYEAQLARKGRDDL